MSNEMVKLEPTTKRADKIEALKKKYPNDIFEGEISFFDENEEQQTVTFIFKKPVTADLEAHQQSAQRNPMVANLNIIQSLIVDPEPTIVIDKIRKYPIAYGNFVEEVISPFFGGKPTAKKRKL